VQNRQTSSHKGDREGRPYVIVATQPLGCGGDCRGDLYGRPFATWRCILCNGEGTRGCTFAVKFACGGLEGTETATAKFLNQKTLRKIVNTEQNGSKTCFNIQKNRMLFFYSIDFFFFLSCCCCLLYHHLYSALNVSIFDISKLAVTSFFMSVSNSISL